MTKAQVALAKLRLTNAGIDPRHIIVRNGLIKVKRKFFYTHGYTAERFRDHILSIVPGSTAVSYSEKWNTWPKDSWWEVVINMPQEAPKA